MDRAVVAEVAHPLVPIVVPGDVDDMTVAAVATYPEVGAVGNQETTVNE